MKFLTAIVTILAIIFVGIVAVCLGQFAWLRLSAAAVKKAMEAE